MAVCREEQRRGTIQREKRLLPLIGRKREDTASPQREERMKTLIELYDERPIENVLASEVFRPEQTVFLCPAEIAQDKGLQSKLRAYFVRKGLTGEPVFLESSLYNSGKLLKQLRRVSEEYADCAVDITGGTDASLFACGFFCAETDIPVFTYSRKRNRFFEIHNAPFADGLPCSLQHTVEDCFLMAGGALRTGRVDNAILDGYMAFYDLFFELYLRYRSQWTKIVNYIQAVSQTAKGQRIPLEIEAAYTARGDRGQRIDAPEKCLRDLEAMGFLRDVQISRSGVSFSFRDLQVRTWLRDIGSVLELYVYKAFRDAALFNDVRTSAVVDWEGENRQDSVTNEIDVMAMQGILPLFISCKTCDVDTDALNELAILRDRFGGNGAKAAIVTTQTCRSITRHRASELGIRVIDRNDLQGGGIASHILALAEPV